ncbi:MAG: TonB-dependent receptor, partial [Bacteroidota bacterium]
GIFRDEAQLEATPAKLPNTTVGEPIYVDTNQDGEIDAGDRIRIHSSNVPEIQYGIFGGFSYKGLDFNFLFQGQADAETLVFFDQSGTLPEHVFTERWTPENPDARYPRAFVQGDPISGNQNTAENFQGADFWLHDASYLRLKNIELGYTLRKETLKFGSMRVFFRGLNLLTMFSEIQKLGLDPEATGYNNFRGSTYPSLKSYSLGVNINFN